jgi:hypothetical protein
MATRQNTLLIKRSNIINKVPPISGLTVGELALNTADAKLYTIFTSGTTGATEVREIGWDRIHRTGDTVTGNFNFFGDIAINGSSQPSGYTLSVSGDTNLTGNVTVTGNLNYDGNLVVTGATIIQSGLTVVEQLVLTTTPTSGYTTTQILMRNSTTGAIEITDSTSPSIYYYGMTYAMSTFNYLT